MSINTLLEGPLPTYTDIKINTLHGYKKNTLHDRRDLYKRREWPHDRRDRGIGRTARAVVNSIQDLRVAYPHAVPANPFGLCQRPESASVPLGSIMTSRDSRCAALCIAFLSSKEEEKMSCIWRFTYRDVLQPGDTFPMMMRKMVMAVSAIMGIVSPC